MNKAAPFVVDMDSHVMEPPDLWDNYLESKYQDRSISIRVNQDGLEELVVDNDQNNESDFERLLEMSTEWPEDNVSGSASISSSLSWRCSST